MWEEVSLFFNPKSIAMSCLVLSSISGYIFFSFSISFYCNHNSQPHKNKNKKFKAFESLVKDEEDEAAKIESK